MKNKQVPKNFTCIQTDVMQIARVKSVQYLGMSLDEDLYWHDHVDQIWASLWKTLGFLMTSKTWFPYEYQNSYIMPSFILGYKSV